MFKKILLAGMLLMPFISQAQTNCGAYNALGAQVCGYNSFCRWENGQELPGSCANRDPNDRYTHCSAYNALGEEVCGYNSFCYWRAGSYSPGQCVNR